MKVMPLHIFLLATIFTLFIASCAKNFTHVYPVVLLDSNLEVNYSNYSEVNSVNRPILKLKKNEVILSANTCKSFIAKKQQGFVAVETITNMHVLSEYQICLQIHYLKISEASNKSYLKKPYKTLIINQLDLQTLRSSLKRKLDDKSETLKMLPFLKTLVKRNSVISENSAWYYKFTILAKGDFNHDGIEDLLVGFIDQAKEGNYFSDSTLVITRNTPSGYLTVVN